VALSAGLTDLDVLVVDVANFTDGSSAFLSYFPYFA
jgi:hypothetical protein